MKAAYLFIISMVVSFLVLASSVLAEDDTSLAEMHSLHIENYTSCNIVYQNLQI